MPGLGSLASYGGPAPGFTYDGGQQPCEHVKNVSTLHRTENYNHRFMLECET